MTVFPVSNFLIYCHSTDTKPTNYATNTICIEYNTGDIFSWNGTSWTQISGDDKVSALLNKTFDYASNTPIGFAPWITKKQYGFAFAYGGSASSTSMFVVQQLLAGIGVTGTAAKTMDTTENRMIVTWTSAAASGSRAGMSANTGTVAPVTMRKWNFRYKVRFKLGQTTSASNMYIGFTSNALMPTTDVPLGTTDHGIVFGKRTTDSTWQVFNNDGSSTAEVVTQFTGAVPVNTNWNTVEFQATDSVPNITVTLNGGTPMTITTRLPAQTTGLAPYAYASTGTGAAAITFALNYCEIESI